MKIFLLYVLLLAAIISQRAFACSSCGSGALDPIILFPNENQKFYLGLSHQSRIRDISSNGEVRPTSGLATRKAASFSVAKRIFQTKTFLSFTGSFIENASHENSARGFLDPLITIRYDLIRHNFTRPYVPMVQLIGSRKMALGRSLHESKDAQLLDIYSTGYDETSLGIDVWFGGLPIGFGASYFYSYTHKDTKDGIAIDPGDRTTLITTLGYTYKNRLKVVGGAICSHSYKMSLDEKFISNSQKTYHSYYAGLETLSIKPLNYRITMSERSASRAKNGTSFTSVTFAIMRGFL